MSLSDVADEDVVIEFVEEAFEDRGVSVKKTHYRQDSISNKYHIQVITNHQDVNGPKRFLNEISIAEQEVVDTTMSTATLVERRVDEAVRGIADELSIGVTVNDHDLVFSFHDGFSAVDHSTGMEWEVDPDDHKHTLRNIWLRQDEDPCAPCVYDSSQMEIPGHLKEQMMMWVIGWALAVDPQSWLMCRNI